MRSFRRISIILVLVLLISAIMFLPVKTVFLFSEKNSEQHKMYYMPLEKQTEFTIRYVHSIHLTDVVETYEVTAKKQIRMLSMSYKNLSIGLPGDAGKGETLELKDGVYTLTYKNRVIDSFIIRIGRVDADLAFQYGQNEIDLKEHLEKGKPYEFSVSKLSFYQLMKGANING